MNDELLEAYIRCQKDRSELMIENERLNKTLQDIKLLIQHYGNEEKILDIVNKELGENDDKENY